MPKMQTATCLVLLGGDTANSVQRTGVTVSEIAVLQKVHGDDAVVDIRPDGEIERSFKEERERLHRAYGKPIDDGSLRSKIVDLLFPGAAAPLFTTFEGAEIDEQFFAQTGRVSINPVHPLKDASEANTEKAVDEADVVPAKPKRGGKKASPTEAPVAEAAPAPAPADEDDGIGDMPPASAVEPDPLFA